MSSGHEEFGEGRQDTLRPDRMLEVRNRAMRAGTHLYRSRSGEWLTTKTKVKTMLYWAAVFLVIAIVAGVFGFGGLAASAAGIAKILFMIFIILFILSALFGVTRSRRGSP
jgi:uncharacterized membrane protein YtjA (UPF0391 family)